jgi:hypothetical protein
MAEGVAHAPDVSCAVADSRTDCDTGGTKRRPLTPHRTCRLRTTLQNPSHPALEWTWPALASQERAGRGNTAPVSVFPLSFRRLGWKWCNQGMG